MKRFHAQAILALLAAALFSTGCFRVSSESKVLRESVMKAAGQDWDQQVEVGVGHWSWTLAQAALSRAHLDPKAHAALRTLRSGDVCVCHSAGRGSKAEPAAVLAAADQAMEKRGWTRLVGVVNGHEAVGVYSPEGKVSERNAQVCVVVFNRQDLVIASASADLRPLFEMAMNEVERHAAR
jgi:hypothetical protein